MTDDFPNIKTGTRFGDTSARQWNNLFQTVSSVKNLAVGDGLEKAQSSNGLRLDLTAATGGKLRTKARVAVTKLDTTASGRIWIRDVAYGTNPPKDGDYKWFGPERQAFPDIGHTQAAFEDLAETGDTPSDTTTVLDAELRGSFWFVKIAGGGPSVTGQRQFELLSWSDDGDTLSCTPLELAEGEERDVVTVARTWGMMQTAWDGNIVDNIRYTYPVGEKGLRRFIERIDPLTDPPERIGLPETQVVARPYVAGDFIMGTFQKTIFIPHQATLITLPDVHWIDGNADARDFVQDVWKAE